MPTHTIGIVGYGKIARDQHESAIRSSPDFELAAVCNVGPGPTPAGVAVFADLHAMLEARPDLSAVAVCSPPGPRRALAVEALAAGRHVLLEKPPAGTVSEAADIGRAAQAAGRVVFAAYHSQHNAGVRRAAERLAGRTVRRLRVDWREDVRRWHPGQEWAFAAGGFGVFDPGINALSILTRILPEPVFVRAARLWTPQGREAPIAAELMLGAGDPADEDLRCAFDWRQTDPQTWDVAVETHDGLRLKLTGGGVRLEVEGEPPFEGAHEEYADVYRAFAELLADGRPQLDLAPFQLVADAFMLASREEVKPFAF